MTAETEAAESTDEDSTQPGDGVTRAAAESADTSGTGSGESSETRDGEPEFGWRGWVLVGAVVVSFLVVPWAIVLLPRVQGFLASLGLGLRDAYLVLPMVPAIGLAVLAVWTALADRRTE